MNKRKIVVLIILIILIITSILLFYQKPEYGVYEIKFSREYSTDEEKVAIETSEHLNYTDYLTLPRFHDSAVNFIDFIVIDFFNDSFFKAKETKQDIRIFYDYGAVANSFEVFNISVTNNILYLNITINDYYEIIIEHESYGLFYSDELAVLKILEGVNETKSKFMDNLEISSIDWNFRYNRTLSNVFLVEQYLSYTKIWGPEAAEYVEIFQIVILDDSYNVKSIILFPSSYSESAEKNVR